MDWKNNFSEIEVVEIEHCEEMYRQFGVEAGRMCEIVAKMALLLDGKDLTVRGRLADVDKSLGSHAVIALQALRDEHGQDAIVTVGMLATRLQYYGLDVTPKKMGMIVIRLLGLEIGKRRGDGFPVLWDEGKMAELRGADVLEGLGATNAPQSGRYTNYTKEGEDGR